MSSQSEALVRIGELGVVPVLVLDRAEDAEPVAEALLAGGLPCAEVTFRTEAGAAAIERMVGAFPDFIVGAGTVLSSEQAEIAAAAGARFVVGPGLDRAVVEWCQRRGIPVIPGVMTPTEVSSALRLGIGLVKFFPAEAAGGVKTLAALAGPFPGIQFLPTGGLDASNLASYLRLPMVTACGASWLADRELIQSRDFAAITARAAAAAAIVRQVRRSQ